MRILCCLDGTNIEQLHNAVTKFAKEQGAVFGLLYVIDAGPKAEMERTRERLLRRPGGPLPPHVEKIQQAEAASAQEILDEGLRYFPGAEPLQREGRPEREIVNCAAEWQADLIIICPRAEYGGKPEIGPKSVGHVARFVLDHAPCPVLLVRPIARDQFPISRKP